MEIVIILLLILLNGVFSMSEIAMVSSRKSRLETAAKKGDRSAKKALELAANPGKFLSTVQIGITLIGILTGIYSGQKIEDDLTGFFNQFESLQKYSSTLAVTVIVITLTFFSLVLGELVPKRIGLTMPESISKVLAFPIHWISVICAPFIWMLTATSDLIIKVFRIKPMGESKVTEEEIKAIIQEGIEGGAIEEIEQDIVERVFSMGDRKISSLMTHRNDVVSLRIDYDAEKIKEIVNSEMHSLYPVIDDKMEVEGIILLKDLFRHINDADFQLSNHLLPANFVTENMSAYEALRLFKMERNFQAIVTDEFGQMEGLVTMNDLLEALVGDVSDFHDDFTFVQREDGSWLIDGKVPLHDFLLRFDLEELAEEYPFNTISGLILNELRRIPKEGDVLEFLQFEIEIMDMDGARIDKVLVTERD